MLSKNRVRVLFTAISAVALTVAFGRCSPVAPSISKNGFNSGNLPSSQPIGEQGSASAPTPGSRDAYDTTVVSNDQSAGTISRLAAGTSRLELDSVSIEEFKRYGRTDIAIADAGSTTVHAVFTVNRSSWQITSDHLDGFETRLDRKAGDTWTISAKRVDSTAIVVRDHLTGITVYIQRGESGDAATPPAPAQ